MTPAGGFGRVHRLMERAVSRRAFPAACLLAARDGQPVIHQAYGDARLDTLFDLASLTKPLAAGAAAMLLAADGELRPRDLAARWIPGFDRPGARRIRLWHLLAHVSGLPDWLPLHEQVMHLPRRRRKAAIRRRAAASPLLNRPGAGQVYSDLGFIVLDWVIQRITGRRLDRLLADRLYGPLGLTHTRFVDLGRPEAPADLVKRHHVAPTERCPWRGGRLRGQVHDDNCWAMGGISGHAGLFSTAHDVHLLVRELAAAYRGARSVFDRRVVRTFLRRWPVEGSTRALSWDTPSPGGSSAGRFFGPAAVGHLGFTGTSVWIDPERSAWIILLTNRVFHGREPNPMIAFRPRLHDAVMRAAGLS